MERKIGETFEFEGHKLKVVDKDSYGCDGCFFLNRECSLIMDVRGYCSKEYRTDKKRVIFVEHNDKQPQDEHPQELNLCEILKYCPQGETFWSPLLGDVKLHDINHKRNFIVISLESGETWDINTDGTITFGDVTSPEIMLYPSREQRDWTKVKYEKKERFNPQTLKPFDRVLCQQDNYSKWQCNLFSHIHPDYKNLDYPVHGMTDTFMYCIPYNDETKHLLGTTDEAPDFYRYWED